MPCCFCVTRVVYFTAFLIYSAFLLLYFGADGWRCPLQAYQGKPEMLLSRLFWKYQLSADEQDDRTAARSSSSGQRFTGLFQFIRSCGNSNWCHIGGIRVLHMLNGCSPSGGLSNHTGKNKSDKPADIYSSDNPAPTASPAPAATQPTTHHWACADRRGGRAQQSPPSARRVRTSV